MSKKRRREKRALNAARNEARQAAKRDAGEAKKSRKALARASRSAKAREAAAAMEAELAAITKEMSVHLENEEGGICDAGDDEVVDVEVASTPAKPPVGVKGFYFGRWDRQTIDAQNVPPCSVHTDKGNARDVFVIHAHGPISKALTFCAECQIELICRLLRDALLYPGLRAILGRVTLPIGAISQLRTFADRLSALGAIESDDEKAARERARLLTENSVEPPTMD
jgi:hypothetical protein